MAILNNYLKPIADAIRTKKNTVLPINAQNFASEIESIEPIYENIELTENGTFDVKDYKKATVNYSNDDLEFVKNLIEGKITKLKIPYGVTRIKGYLFEETDSMSSGENCIYISIPNTVKEFKNKAFNFRTYPTEREVYFQGSLEEWCGITIPNYYSTPFDDGSTMAKFYVNDKNGNKVFVENFILDETSTIEEIKAYTWIYYPLSKIDLSKSNVKYIRGNAFSQTYPSEILLSDKIEILEESCFALARVEEFTFPPKVTTINALFGSSTETIKKINFAGNPTIFNSNAFQLKSLTTFRVPSSVTSMGGNAMKIGSTTNKATIIMESATPCSITTTTFQATYLNKIFVPKGTSATYKAATNWSSFADYIFEPNNIQINVDSSLVNNESVTYSIDDEPFEQFTSNTISLENVSTLVVKSTDANTTILIGTTQGSNDIGTVANATSSVYTFESDTNVYITVQ